MPDFSFVHDSYTDSWLISAPRRSRRPNSAKGTMAVCPFCPAQIAKEESVYEVSGISSQVSQPKADRPLAEVVGNEFVSQSDNQSDELKTDRLDSENRPQTLPAGRQGTDNWLIKVIKNKFPFAPVHEVIILSPEHHLSYDSFSLHQVELAIQTYRQRFQTYQAEGQVYIFHNHGPAAGESIPHAHSQLVVIPNHVGLDIPPPLPTNVLPFAQYLETDHFIIHCPKTAKWPDEVWVSPKRAGKLFSEVNDDEVNDLAFVLSRLVKIFKLRYAHDFPYNFYIYPKEDWYFRLIPRKKTLGGFEVGTDVFVNTQDPLETLTFIREHFMTPDEEKILQLHQVEYHQRV